MRQGEVAAIPELSEQIELKKSIVMIDAAGALFSVPALDRRRTLDSPRFPDTLGVVVASKPVDALLAKQV